MPTANPDRWGQQQMPKASSVLRLGGVVGGKYLCGYLWACGFWLCRLRHRAGWRASLPQGELACRAMAFESACARQTTLALLFVACRCRRAGGYALPGLLGSDQKGEWILPGQDPPYPGFVGP